MKSTYLAILVLGTLAATALAAQGPMRAGRWEVTMQMQMPSVPVQMPEMKTTQCVTPEQLKDPASALPSASPNAGAQQCKVSDYKTSGNTVTWKVACAPPTSVNGSGEMTFTGDSYAGAMKMTTQQGEMTMKLTGRRVGDCPS
jgi:hypothetical protein